MSQQMSLEQLISDWMADEASGVASDQLINRITTTTRRQRPRPRWLAVLQESPMHAQARVVVGSPTRRLTFAVALLVLAAVLAAAVAGAILLRPQPTSDDWPGFRGDPSRIGLAATGPIGNPVVQWAFHADGAISRNVSIAGQLALFSSDDGILHAVGVADGAERWSFTAAPPMSGPLAIDGRVYAADGAGVVHALSLDDGRILWTSQTSLQSPGDFTILDGRLFAGTADGLLVAIDASDGAERWRVQVSPAGIAVHAPSVAKGLVVAATDDLQVTALNPDTGEIRWSLKVGDTQIGTPVLADGAVYIGGSPDSTIGALVALDANDGSERWRVDEDLYAPSIAGGIGYTGSPSGTVSARDLATGRELWRAQFPGIVRAPAVAGNVVYVTADRARIIAALDKATGGVLWTFDVDGASPCCIAAARGLVFAGTLRGTVYAIGGDGATLVPQAVAASSAPSRSAATPTTPPLLAAKLAWATDPPDGGVPWGLSRAPDGRLWAAEAFTNEFAIYTSDGKFVERWGAAGSGEGQFDLTRSNGDPYGMVAFAPDGSFYVLDVGNRRVQHFDADRHFLEAWGEFGSDPGQFSDPISLAIDGDGIVYVLDDVREVIESYDAHGKVLATIPAFPPEVKPNDGANQLAIGPDGHFFVGVVFPNEVAELDKDGALIRTYGAAGSGPGAFTDQPNGIGFDAAGRRYVTAGPGRGDAPGVQVFDATGTYLGGIGALGTGDADLGFAWGLVVTDDGIYVADASGVPDVGMRSAIRKFEPITFP